MSPEEKLTAAVEALTEIRGPLREKADRWEVYDDLGIWAIRSGSGTPIGIDFMEEDAVEIVALRRTIDPLLAYLGDHLADVVQTTEPPSVYALALADAILGDPA